MEKRRIVRPMYYVVVSDSRYGNLYGAAVSDDGFYCTHPNALVKPVKFSSVEAARQDARFRTAATRINGEGKSREGKPLGILHTVMRETDWIQYAIKRRVKEQKSA